MARLGLIGERHTRIIEFSLCVRNQSLSTCLTSTSVYNFDWNEADGVDRVEGDSSMEAANQHAAVA